MDSSTFAKPNKAFRIIDLIKEVNASGSVKVPFAMFLILQFERKVECKNSPALVNVENHVYIF